MYFTQTGESFFFLSMENVPEGTRKHKLPGKRKRERMRVQIGLNHLQNGSVATENEEKLTEKLDGKRIMERTQKLRIQ